MPLKWEDLAIFGNLGRESRNASKKQGDWLLWGRVDRYDSLKSWEKSKTWKEPILKKEKTLPNETKKKCKHFNRRLFF